jgi:hypothetical protein
MGASREFSRGHCISRSLVMLRTLTPQALVSEKKEGRNVQEWLQSSKGLPDDVEYVDVFCWVLPKAR